MSIYDLCTEVAEFPNMPAEWIDKMIHRVPAAPVFDRADYLVKACRGKKILDIGASGPMSEKLQEVAAWYRGCDITPQDRDNFFQIDLDKANELPIETDIDLIIAGEVIEHLSNAGHFLDLLYPNGAQVILTTPNAFSVGSRAYLARNIEAVNGDHVAWYSYQTLKTLVSRHGFRVLLWGWYNGKPMTAEGLIFHMEPDYGND
jgi:2-polyprenyl-3-methyl-5-hydroxy-6-metoxy-1,4-benzoquinol methylase